MLDFFQIQVENPMQLLTQDTSRQFLTSKKPEDKYNFFMQATHLSAMALDYNKAITANVDIKSQLRLHEKSMSAIKVS